MAFGAGRGDGADRPAGAAGRTMRHQRAEGIAGSTRSARAAALRIALQLAKLTLGLTRLSAIDRGRDFLRGIAVQIHLQRYRASDRITAGGFDLAGVEVFN